MKQLLLLRKLTSFVRHRPPTSNAAAEGEDCSPAPKKTPATTWHCFTYSELHTATNGFHRDNMVGRGGHGEVYRGALKDGRTVAVKRLADDRCEREFLTEVGTVGHADHPNVTPLLGCCVDRGLYLVFPFSSRGSVASNLHGGEHRRLHWSARHGIAVGAARGLQYLHSGCRRRIIHRDIKASNILLDDDFRPQISDFGLARWLPAQWSHRAVAPIEGTFGCLAPEYFTQGVVDEKTDVFAFGVFILELVSGRRPVDGSHRNLLCWARPHLAGDVRQLADERLRGEYDSGQLERLALVASLCIRPAAAWRPTMTQVVELLEDSGEVPPERWKMPEEVALDEYWDLDDLEDDYDDDDDDDEDEDDEDLDSLSLFSSTCST